jgi:hypothetical protein
MTEGHLDTTSTYRYFAHWFQQGASYRYVHMLNIEFNVATNQIRTSVGIAGAIEMDRSGVSCILQ